MRANVVRFNEREQAKQKIILPGPRIWNPRNLAEFLGVSIHWVYKRCEKKAVDPVPRVPGVGRLRFDTDSLTFQSWLGRKLGCVDTGEDDE